MKKIIYYIGIYHICLGIHEGLEFLHEEIQKRNQNEKRQKKGAIGIQPEPAKKPMNKIGFEIPQV